METLNSRESVGLGIGNGRPFDAGESLLLAESGPIPNSRTRPFSEPPSAHVRLGYAYHRTFSGYRAKRFMG